MKIGIIKETKIPVDNRVAISPRSAEKILLAHKDDVELYLEKSNRRAFKTNEYDYLGVKEVEDMSQCDVLFGVKEVNIEDLIPNKHYFFFGHIAKMQVYNKPLLKAMMEKKITFTDYEYLTDGNDKRVCSFGFYAGVVGMYNTFRLIGEKYNLFNIGKMSKAFYDIDQLLPYKDALKNANINILITGDGKVSGGVQMVLKFLGFEEVPLCSDELATGLHFSVARTADLVERADGAPFDREDFGARPQLYVSKFDPLSEKYRVLVATHKWEQGQPRYLTEKTLRNANNMIRVVGDITCDIKGSICTTVRPSTHDKPFYGVKLSKDKIVNCSYKRPDNISVIAVDNLPNAMPRTASIGFSTELLSVILDHLLVGGLDDEMIQRATILKEGVLTDKFNYLKDFIGG